MSPSVVLSGVAAGLFGALIGSFLNVVVRRVPRRESLMRPGSHCPSCKAAIAPYDNVPVVSWLLLRGRCRHCHSPISVRYPALELLTAFTFVAILLTRGVGWQLLLDLPFAALLIAVAGIDLEHRIVPNRLVVPAAAYGIGVTALVQLTQLPEALIAGAGAFAFLLVVALLHPAGMGMGDAKLAGVMGIFLGVTVVPALLCAFLAGSVAGVTVVARHGAAARKRGIPFAPFLALGGIVGLLAGPELVELYVHSFLD